MSSEEDEDALPAWITNHKSPSKQSAYKSIIQLSESDSESDIAAEPAEVPALTAEEPQQAPKPAAAVASPGATAQAAGSGRKKAAGQAAAAKAKFGHSLASARKPAAKKAAECPGGAAAPAAAEAAAAAAAASRVAADGGNEATAAAAAEAAKRLSQTNAEAGPSQLAAAAAAADAGAGAAADPSAAPAGKTLPQPMLAAVAGEVPVVLSDKLTINKAIAELETLEGGQTDLTGDSGAVGRVLIAQDEDAHHMQFDLKGVIYNVRHAALPGTLMVVNIGQTEAKVESVLDTFLQLQRTSAFADDEEDHKYFMEEDEDNYQYDPAYAVKAAEGGDKKSTRKRDAKPRAKPRPSGGVKKKKKPATTRKPATKRK